MRQNFMEMWGPTASPEQVSRVMFVTRVHQLLSSRKERLSVGLYVRGRTPKMPGGEDEHVRRSSTWITQRSNYGVDAGITGRS